MDRTGRSGGRKQFTAFRVVLVMAALLSGVAFLVGAGYDRSAIEFGHGSVWLPNEELGELAHVTGPSQEVDFRSKHVAGAGDEMDLTSTEDSIYVLNRTDGVLSRFDPRSGVVDATTDAVSSGEDVQVVADADSLYVLDGSKGRALVLNPQNLHVQDRVRIGRGHVSGALDEAGVLWTVEPRSGDLLKVRGTEVAERFTLDADPSHRFAVSVYDGVHAGVFDLTDAMWLRPDEDPQSLPSDVSAPIRPGVGETEWASFTANGQWIAMGGNTSVQSSAELAEGDRLGVPHSDADRVFIGDPTTGELLVVERESGELLHRVRLAGESSGLVVDASDRYGFAVIAGTSDAFVVDPDGEQTQIDLGSANALILDARSGDTIEPEDDEGSGRTAEERGINREFTGQRELPPEPDLVDPGPAGGGSDPEPPEPEVDICTDRTTTPGDCIPCDDEGTTAVACELCFDGRTAVPNSCPEPPPTTAGSERCDDGSVSAPGTECTACGDGTSTAAGCKDCWNGSNIPNSRQCPGQECGDQTVSQPDTVCETCGNGVSTASGCQTCWDGDGPNIPNTAECPPDTRERCDDNTVADVGTTCEECGNGISTASGCQTCDDGSNIPNTSTCPAPPPPCDDGTPAPCTPCLNGATTSAGCQDCPDGSNIPSTYICPTTSSSEPPPAIGAAQHDVEPGYRLSPMNPSTT